MSKKPVMLMILDGFGFTDKKEGNAIASAHKPNFDSLWNNYPHTFVSASGLDVGLPAGQMGNSEVGHLNIGAGRVIYQELTRITKDVEEGTFFKNEALNLAMDEALKKNASLHLLGLLSDGGVHSHINHLKALLKMAKDKGLERVYLHAFLDGRDVPPKSGKSFIIEIEDYMNEIQSGKIATVSGRYYAMDRDKRWERVNLAYNAMVLGKGEFSTDVAAAVEESYSIDKTDEFVLPIVVTENEKPVATIKDNDSVIFFNFRPDRAREITRAINDRVFDAFPRETLDLTYVCMTQYDKTLENVHVAYKPETYGNTLGEYLGKCGKKQLRIAETEKYAHVTFFFNGGVEAPNENEDRVLIPSPKVATYDLKPEMSCFEVMEEVLKRIESDEYDVIILNFANPDMVGHTGVFDAAKKAIEAVDVCVGKIHNAVSLKGGTIFLTADHGNAEEMIDFSTGEPMTAHTSNLVPFVYITSDENPKGLRDGGKLCDISPTILEELGLEIPNEMTGKPLFK